MKPLQNNLTFLIFLGFVIQFSCQKKFLCPDCDFNKSPVANAGIDQTIVLPKDSTILDGNASSDADGTIVSYSWLKISGPLSANISNPNSANTITNNLVRGVYQFELTVTDNSGLTGKDTMHLFVNAKGSSSTITVAGCNASMTPFGQLSQSGSGNIRSAGSKIFFTGNDYNSTANNVTDIYDTITQTWSTTNLKIGNINLGSKLLNSKYNYPINKQVFEIYDASTGVISTHITPEARVKISHTIVDNKIFFAGGYNPDSNYITSSKRLDIYDAASNTWTLQSFNQARGGMAVASSGNKIFFAGGYEVRYDSLIASCDDSSKNCIMIPAIVPSSRIDIYDLSNNSWSLANLSEPRSGITTTVVGNKILFAGGGISKRIDIYDVPTNTWSTTQLSDYIYDQFGRKRAHTVGNKVLFTRLSSKIVDIYDATNNSVTTAQMGQINSQTGYTVAVRGNKIIFFTVFDLENISKNIDIYDALTNTWCNAVLNTSWVGAGIITVGNKVYIAGGITKTNPNGIYDKLVDDIWIVNF